jgi:hypothetical protein
MDNPALVIPVIILGFAALWFGIIKIISLLGWQRLATHYQVDRLPLVRRHWLSLAYVRFIQYQSVIRAGASEEGLNLSVIFPFRVGHPPLLIPWHAIGPVYYKKKMFHSLYSITIRIDDTTSLEFGFADSSLLAELRPWLSVIDAR